MTHPRPRVLIVGAGPTGLTAAVELARCGVIPTIVEKRQAASTWSRAVGILPRSLEIFQPSGVAASLMDAGVLARGFCAYVNGAMALRALIPRSAATRQLLLLPQDQTEQCLRSAVERFGAKVDYGREVCDLAQDSRGVNAIFADGSKCEYDYVVGADGIESTVRASQGIAFDGDVLPEEWSIADVDARDWPHPEHFVAFLNQSGEVVVSVPIGSDRYRVIANRTNALQRLPIPMNVTQVRRAGDFQIPVRQAETYQKGRVYLAGDAAHCHSPVGGRGMNIGIADAADLAGRLINGELEAYTATRHPVGKEVIQLTERARKIITSDSAFIRFGLKTALAIAQRVPRLKQRGVKFMLQT